MCPFHSRNFLYLSSIAKVLHLILLLLVAAGAWAQDSIPGREAVRHVQIELDREMKVPPRWAKAFRKLNDSLKIDETAREVELEATNLGYTEAAIDGWKWSRDSLTLDMHLGERYFIRALSLEGLSEIEYQKSGYEKWLRRPTLFDPVSVQEKLRENLDAYQNQGYPFARFDSLELAYGISGDSILVDMGYAFEPGKLVRIDSVRVEGEVRETDAFVRGMTGLQSGLAYDQSAIDAAPKILNNSIYFKNVKPLQVDFVDEETANLTIKVEPRKAGKFDLLLGLLPPRNDNERFEFTGLADFLLVSPIFRAGETIEFRYDKLVGSSQKLRLRYAHPYLFGSPLQVQGEFDLLKQDTIFLTRFFRLSTAYAFNPNLAVQVYYKSKTSSLIATNQYDSLRPPPVLDARDQTYGIGFEFQNLDYRLSPRKGWHIRMDFGIGRKRIIDNPTLDDRIYNGLVLRLPKREAEFQLQYFKSYSKRLVLMLANRTYWLDQAEYFQNDLLQVGGSRTIRGFDENQFFANLMTQFTIENRFLLEQNSYLFVFSDYAYLEDRSENGTILRPWGFGLGMTYETRAGMVSLTYAAGRVADFPFQPSRGRIHVGLVNQF